MSGTAAWFGLRLSCDHVTMQRACENIFFRKCPVHELKAPWFASERITTERNWHPVHELWMKRDHADELTNLDKRGHTLSLGCPAFSSRSAVTHNCFNCFSSTFTFRLDYKLRFCCTLQIQGLCLPLLLSNCPKNILFCASLSLPLWKVAVWWKIKCKCNPHTVFFFYPFRLV